MRSINDNKRRSFLKKIGIGLATTLVGTKLQAALLPESSVATLKTSDGSYDEPYWEMVKRQFIVPKGMVMINSANLCPCPHFVTEKVTQYTQRLAHDVSFQNREVFGEYRNRALEKLADYLEVSIEEIGITRNTSESNNIIVNGLDLKPKDEVIVWEQNHPTNLIAWHQRAKRQGFKVIEIALPAQPDTIEELVGHFEKAVTSRTKLIAFSHISNVSGLAMPAAEICKMAKAKGILTLVDGAQSFGFMDLKLKELDCTFYTGSAHKWLMGPLENGVIYIAKEQIPFIWPNIISAGWQEDHKTLDEKVCVLGQRNTPSTSAMIDILDFHVSIGKAPIEKRVRYLNTYLKEQLKAEIPNVIFVTPLSETFSGGVTIIQLPNKDSSTIFKALYTDYGIATAPSGGIRISPQINCVKADIDYLVKALKELA
ncbi:MAG: aminotransferase class V-fold PLP-dependent enzyme [Flavobacteriaceae bacterium]